MTTLSSPCIVLLSSSSITSEGSSAYLGLIHVSDLCPAKVLSPVIEEQQAAEEENCINNSKETASNPLDIVFAPSCDCTFDPPSENHSLASVCLPDASPQLPLQTSYHQAPLQTQQLQASGSTEEDNKGREGQNDAAWASMSLNNRHQCITAMMVGR